MNISQNQNTSDIEFVLTHKHGENNMHGFKSWLQQYRQRRTIRYLERQDYRVLQDMGIERYQVKEYVLSQRKS